MLKLDLWKLLLDLKSIASDILRYIFEPAEWIQYIAIYLTCRASTIHSLPINLRYIYKRVSSLLLREQVCTGVVQGSSVYAQSREGVICSPLQLCTTLSQVVHCGLQPTLLCVM